MIYSMIILSFPDHRCRAVFIISNFQLAVFGFKQKSVWIKAILNYDLKGTEGGWWIIIRSQYSMTAAWSFCEYHTAVQTESWLLFKIVCEIFYQSEVAISQWSLLRINIAVRLSNAQVLSCIKRTRIDVLVHRWTNVQKFVICPHSSITRSDVELSAY